MTSLLVDERGAHADEMTFSNIAGVLPALDKVSNSFSSYTGTHSWGFHLHSTIPKASLFFSILPYQVQHTIERSNISVFKLLRGISFPVVLTYPDSCSCSNFLMRYEMKIDIIR